MDIGFVPEKGETLYASLCKLKQKNGFEDCKDVVHSVPCVGCGLRYLGETGGIFVRGGNSMSLISETGRRQMAFYGLTLLTQHKICRVGIWSGFNGVFRNAGW